MLHNTPEPVCPLFRSAMPCMCKPGIMMSTTALSGVLPGVARVTKPLHGQNLRALSWSLRQDVKRPTIDNTQNYEYEQQPTPGTRPGE